MGNKGIAEDIIYEAVYRLLPTMGRDFEVSVDIVRNGDTFRTSVNIKPLTELGRVIIPYMRRHIRDMISTVGKEYNDNG